MSAMQLKLVAETNENGAIDWVWHWRPHFAAAKPVSSFGDIAFGLGGAEFSGASREAILAWITRTLVDEPSGEQKPAVT